MAIKRMSQSFRRSTTATIVSLMLIGGPGAAAEQPRHGVAQQADFAATCTTGAMSALVSGLPTRVTIKWVPNGVSLPGGVKYTPASAKAAAFCQVTGSYVTNRKTGKTSNFVAAFPENWNHKYLQVGCAGQCGVLVMGASGALAASLTQGYPRQVIEKGYAAFADDLGHEQPIGSASVRRDWRKSPDGSDDQDAVDDFNYRSDLVLADMGQAFTRAFYGRLAGHRTNLERAYFCGCSQGGREALVAATRFPEKFDGIIVGSPAADLPGIMAFMGAREVLAREAGLTKLTTGQIVMLNKRILDSCDGLDGVTDGLIQNPAVCGFHPLRDLPICAEGRSADDCVTKEQANAISVFLTAATNRQGEVLQPGYAVGKLTYASVAQPPAGEEGADTPSATESAGGSGPIDAVHAVLDEDAYRRGSDVGRAGVVTVEDFSRLRKSKTKIFWYHNLTDESLSPYLSINMYRRLAKIYGGYANLRKQIRLFLIPGTPHCDIDSEEPGNFDAIGAIEAWVERGVFPDAVVARRNDLAAGKTVDWSQRPLRTMPLCAFPEMASYRGRGDLEEAENWECRASDTRMLQVGVAGRLAGAIQ